MTNEISCYSSQFESLRTRMHRFVHRWCPRRISKHRADRQIEPWATVVMFHGFGGHGFRFDRIATWMASQGIAVQAVDLVGHGHSPGRRGCIESYDQLLEEVTAAYDNARSHWDYLPTFTLGHSMGGNFVLNGVLRGCFRPAGSIALSPMLRTVVNVPPHRLRVGQIVAKFAPNFRVRAEVDYDTLSQDSSMAKLAAADPLTHQSMSLRLGFSLVESGQWAIENAARLTSPALLMHGEQDTITCSLAAEQFVVQSHPYSSFKMWSGLRHNLYDESSWIEIAEELHNWMSRVIDGDESSDHADLRSHVLRAAA